MKCECGGEIVYLADGTPCCSRSLARFEAIYGYRPRTADEANGVQR